MAKVIGKSAGGKLARKPASRAKPAAPRLGLATTGPVPGSGFLDSVRLKKSGGSLVMTVPASARRLLGLTEGQDMAISVRGNKVIAEPVAPASVSRVRRPKYTLDDLLTGYPDGSDRADSRWMDGPPAGRETW